jgi:glycosyltransferase involved in cell wall biosynthesis
MNVLFIGHYDPQYPRNAAILKGLRASGVNVHEVRVGLSRPARLLNLIKGWRKYRRSNPAPDMIMVPMIDLETAPFAYVLSKMLKIPLIYDAFVCRYAGNVIERGRNPKALKSRSLYFLEKFVLKKADLILADAGSHADLFVDLYKIAKEKFYVMYISLDDDLFRPDFKASDNNSFIVQFLGFFHPLTGADTIVRAADLLRDEKEILIEIIGVRDNESSKNILNLAESLNVNNIKFMDAIPYDAQPEHMKRASVCLGVFGDTDQAARVFPNKGYQALAMAKTLITRDCPALHEILEPGTHLEVVPPANPQALADTILKLKREPEYRNKIASQGHEYFKEKLSPAVLGDELKKRLLELLNK